MQCPEDGAMLQRVESHGVSIDECPQCHGRWFDRDELRRAKDSVDEDLRWLDFDPFAGDPDEPPAGVTGRICPRDEIPMGVIPYQDSSVRMDKCFKCHGVWLSHGEFERIVRYLEKRVNSETAGEYEREAIRQMGQVFTGHEGPASEARDLFAVLHLLRMRWAVEHDGISQMLDAISRGGPF